MTKAQHLRALCRSARRAVAELRRWERRYRAEEIVQDIRRSDSCDTSAAVVGASERLGKPERWIWQALRAIREQKKKRLVAEERAGV